MPERTLQTQDHVNRQSSPTTAWSYEDQEAALREGFNSVSEWGLFHLVRKHDALEARVAALEGLAYGPEGGDE